MKYVLSAFSLQMLPDGGIVRFQPVSEETALQFACSAISAVGHPATADILGVEMVRRSVTLVPGDCAIVAQPSGRRLDVGEEVDTPALKYYLVEVFACAQ